MKELNWLIPSVILTLICGTGALLAIPNYAGLIAALKIYPAWIVAATLIGALCLLLRMARLKEARPIAELQRLAVDERARLHLVALVVLVSGLNMIAFMWVKPLLNYYVPFWAGPYLARIDNFLFFGHDPWRLLAWLNFPAAGVIYHQVWFVMMILALIIVAWARPSPEKSAMMLTYFVLWSLIGPLVHSLMPAAGPLFYERLGYGDRFANLHQWPETKQISDYLWSTYASRQFGAGSGISAMPSLHVTMASWIALAICTFERSLALPAILFAGMIFLMSIALGWHYAVDGIVGAACAVGCYSALLAVFRPNSMPIRKSTGKIPALEPLR